MNVYQNIAEYGEYDQNDNDAEYCEDGDKYENEDEVIEGDVEEGENENKNKNETEEKKDDGDVRILEELDDDDEEENMGIFKSVSKIQMMEAEQKMHDLLNEKLIDCIAKRLQETIKPIKFLEERLTLKQLSYRGYKINLEIHNENQNEENSYKKSKRIQIAWRR